MRAKRSMWQTVLITLLAGIVLQILFDPLSSILHWGESFQARMGLPLARRRWELQEIGHYRFDIKGFVPLACMFGGSVEVEDGKVVRTSPSSDTGTDRNPFLDSGFLAREDFPAICNVENYTISRLFDEVERFSPSDIAKISFDPDYGFVSSFEFGNCGG